MMTTSSFMSTLTAFAFVVGSLLRIALKVSIFSSLIHSHKLKVRSGLLEAAALFKLVLMVLCRRLISPGRELCTSLSWTDRGRPHRSEERRVGKECIYWCSTVVQINK